MKHQHIAPRANSAHRRVCGRGGLTGNTDSRLSRTPEEDNTCRSSGQPAACPKTSSKILLRANRAFLRNRESFCERQS